MNEHPAKRKVLAMIAAGFVVASAMSTSVPVFAQSQRIVVSGVVTGAGGDPKGLARIELAGPRQFVVMSDAAGGFTIRDFVPGTYQVTVRQRGNYQTLTMKIETNSLKIKVNW